MIINSAIIIFLSFIINIGSAYAGVDKELIQSARCVHYFRYYESKFKIPRDTLYSISLQETGKFHTKKKLKLAWPWTVNVEGKGFYFDTKKEAVAFVKTELRKGKESIDVGCMQVNLKHHPDAFRSVESAFEPKINIAYGASFLRSKYDTLNSWGKAVSHYHSATSHLGEKYKDNVVKIAKNIDHYKSAFKRNRSPQVTQNIDRQKQRRIYTSNIRPNRSTIRPELREKRYRSNMMIYVPSKLKTS